MATRTSPEQLLTLEQAREQVFNAFRQWGHLQARLDPLGQYLEQQPVPELDIDSEYTEEARRRYCGNVGAEFMHISDARKREWISSRMESDPTSVDRQWVLDQLVRADIFEQVIQARYLGTKRFSLEGCTALIPFLDAVFDQAAEQGIEKAIVGMSHRGRLNVMVNTVGISPTDIFAKFEDVDPRSTLGGGDVKYHQGATGTFKARSGAEIAMHLVSNPSHLEAVDPVAMGRTRARQTRMGAGGEDKVLLVCIHGDAAFAGQGIWAETLNLSNVCGFDVGGSIQVIVNNLIGFTAEPDESNSSRYSSDVAKRLQVPIFHVNAEDAEAVVRVAQWAADYRRTFHSDVIIDLVGYRRHGHSEVDDPTVTQPLRYRAIQQHPALYQIYAKQIGVDPSPLVSKLQQQFTDAQKSAKSVQKMPLIAHAPSYWDRYTGGRFKPEYDVETGISRDEVLQLAQKITQYPEGFHIHPKVKKLLEQRLEMGEGRRSFDYGTAEQIAFASLLAHGVPIRMTGQDTQRGTFNQRHSVLVDIENEQRYFPLQHIKPDQPRFEIYNSTLSEQAVLGFEYGYSRDYPETLVLWEAQFGDFANGAQIIIDQFVSSSEDKWGLLSGLVMLLPHGYEGQGPEHSSARVERYLQLAARDNMQICQPSTAAQYFHLLRRQALRNWRKPLVVFTPKAMLRHPDAMSPIDDFSRPHFLNVVPETEVQNPKRLVFCTGKIGHELRVERAKRKDTSVGVVFIDQLYPWPEQEILAELNRHPHTQEIVWVQEEPANMGALTFVMPRLQKIVGDRRLLSIKRSAAASPATGSAKAHQMEQDTIISFALGHSSESATVQSQ